MMAADSTPDFEDVIRLGIEQRLFTLCTALPGIVQSYDPKTQTASIQPALMRSYDGVSVPMAVILKVPVAFPRAASWQISGPVKAGDTGLLVFSQRSIDAWKKQGGVVDPKNPRKFHVTDATFWPGLVPEASARPTAGDNLVLENGKARLDLTPDGKVEFTMAGGAKLVDTLVSITDNLSQLAGILAMTTTNTQLGPQPLKDAGGIGELKAAVDELKASLEGLKG